jgi:hypothetical protein
MKNTQPEKKETKTETPAAMPIKVKMIDSSGAVIQYVPKRFVDDMKRKGYTEI